ncbi:MAG: HU family DNA-binding protein [Bacteroidales bacterium]
MDVKYDWYRTPVPNHRGETPQLHARVVESGTVDSEMLAERVAAKTALAKADITAALVALADEMEQCLLDGFRVHIGGIGFFRLTLKNPAVQNEKDIRAESITVKNIVFRAEKSFKERFKGLHPTKLDAVKKNHSRTYDEGQADAKLRQFFSAHTLITRRDFQSLFGLRRSTAIRRLAELIAAGKIKRTGYRNAPLYFRGENLN